MKQLYVTFTLLFACTFAFAQKSFQDGFIVQNGDTIRGLVDYRGSVRSAEVTTFKKNEHAAEQALTPHDIQAYGFDKGKKLFEAFEITLAPAGDTVRQRVFLAALVKGKASVYHYRDSFQKDRYFLRKDGQPLIELLYEETLLRDTNSGKLYKAKRRAYAHTMAVAFTDCETIKAGRFQNLKFTADALAEITEDYNACVGGSTAMQKS
ncbi:MAG: hypothetical protein LPK03_13160 [Pontibacter sp.]|nr:hypothetical protein [Pontibacter sp.]